MNPESSSFARCVRHPSQFFTGFCSFCLVERLSTVGSVQRSPKPSVITRQKQGECPLPSSESGIRPTEVRERKTLLSLFHMEDSLDDKNAMKDHGQMNSELIGAKSNFGSRVTESRSGFKNDFGGQKFNSKTWVSSSLHASNAVSVNGCATEKRCSTEEESLKDKSVSFWLGSVFTRKVMNWRIGSASGNSLMQQNWMGEKQSEATVDMGRRSCDPTVDLRRRSCDHKMSCDLNKGVWEDPRHSWDGVMMGKAFTPSFAGIGRTGDSNSGRMSDVEWHNSSMTHRRRMSLPEDTMMVDPRPSSVDGKDASTAYLPDTVVSVDSHQREHPGDVHFEEPQQGITVLNVRKRSHGWSKVWNRSITSPFWQFIRRRENVLERSLSESWRGRRGEKNLETMETDGGIHFRVSDINSANNQQILRRNKNVGNGHLQRYRPDCQKKKDCTFGRSRSVHYPSPGNPDNGLLRFYLTPLRSSRRATSKRKAKTTRSFARSILGL